MAITGSATSAINRRDFLRISAVSSTLCGAPAIVKGAKRRRPNILFAISDDQSFAHTSAAGCRTVRTPAFDRVAERGVLFTNAICGSPGCAPSRAAILTGRHHWQLREAGTHASYFPTDLVVYPQLLEAAGYHVGMTGKGAGPANFQGWKHNPAGRSYDRHKLSTRIQGLSALDYAANFAEFLNEKPEDRPFCFWFGATEPHRAYREGVGRAAGKKLEDVQVPAFLPDCEIVRSDILDYCFEIEHFDKHLGQMLDLLEKRGELENTIVVVTSDNGMPFPRAKANMYEYGIHLPLAISWPAEAPGGRVIEDVVSFVDFAPTFLEAAGLTPPPGMVGQSLLGLLCSKKSGRVDPKRNVAYSGRERHSHARYDNLGYPSRAIRTERFLYIRNFAPERWPAGDPPGFYDIDDSPTKRYLLEHREDPTIRRFFELACGKRPAEELYDVVADPDCVRNLAGEPRYQQTKQLLATQLERTLRETGDPRVLGDPDIWESYPRFSPMRPELGGFAEQGKYNPKYQRGMRKP